MKFLIIATIIVYLIIIFLTLITYILNGIGYTKLAKKVGIENGWLSFVPIANFYLLGKFAEKDNEVYHPDDKPKKWSKILLISSAASLIITLLFCVFTIISAVLSGIMVAGSTDVMVAEESSSTGVPIIISLIVIVVSILLIVASITCTVLQYIAMYKTLHLMAPAHAVWILIVSILVTSLAYNIALLVFAFSKKFPTYLCEQTYVTEEAEIPTEV